MRVYAVAIRYEGSEKLSQEAYSSLEAAQRFIRSRSPEPGRLSMTKFRDSEGREYLIHDLLVRKDGEEKTFWRVCQKYFDDGRVSVNVYSVKATKKPDSTSVEGKTFDEYNDYFETREEADEWAENARKA